MQRKYFGVMLDMSRNGVMKPSMVNRFVDYISSFGYNMLQLYTEDTYEVKDEPYFLLNAAMQSGQKHPWLTGAWLVARRSSSAQRVCGRIAVT